MRSLRFHTQWYHQKVAAGTQPLGNIRAKRKRLTAAIRQAHDEREQEAHRKLHHTSVFPTSPRGGAPRCLKARPLPWPRRCQCCPRASQMCRLDSAPLCQRPAAQYRLSSLPDRKQETRPEKLSLCKQQPETETTARLTFQAQDWGRSSGGLALEALHGDNQLADYPEAIQSPSGQLARLRLALVARHVVHINPPARAGFCLC